MNRGFLKAIGMKQSDLAVKARIAEASVSRLVSGSVEPTKSTIDRVLAALSKHLGRPVLYEEAFGSPKRRKKAA